MLSRAWLRGGGGVFRRSHHNFLHTFSSILSAHFQPKVTAGQVIRSGQMTKPPKTFVIAL